MKNRGQFIIVLLAFVFFFGSCLAQTKSFVIDSASVFSVEELRGLNEIFSKYEKETSVEIAVLTCKSLKNSTIEDYSLAMAKQLAIGKKYVNNGILICIAPNDRKIRIELGYGIEWVISDLQAKTILDKITPLLKDSKFAEACRTAFEELKKLMIGTDWKISYRSIEELERDNRYTMNKIVLLKGSIRNNELTLENGRTFTVTASVHGEALLKKALTVQFICVRISHTEPFSFQLLGVNK